MSADLLDPAAGVAYAVLAIALWRQPRARLLAIISCILWFAGGWFGPAVFAHRGPITHLMLAYPRDRLTGRAARAVTVGCYVAAFVYPIGWLGPVNGALAVAIATVAVWDWRAAWGAERRARAISAAAVCAMWAVLAAGAAARAFGGHADRAIVTAYDLAVALGAVIVLLDSRYRRWSRGTVAGLAVDLGAAAPRSLRDVLAEALADPTLVLAYVGDEEGDARDETGMPVRLTPGRPGRTTTELVNHGRRVAVIEHDGAVLQDPALAEQVGVLVTMGLQNAQLQRELSDRTAELERSRQRLLSVADDERRAMVVELEAGALARLAHAAALVAELAVSVDALARVHDAQESLRHFARGLGPAALVHGGLSGAIEELAGDLVIPVTVAVTCRRYPPDVEAAAYFVCAEALTNTVKYADATHADVVIDETAQPPVLTVEVRDDGAGGANPAHGTGLAGLADRLDVIGGHLTVLSNPGNGTVITARIPLVNPSARWPADGSSRRAQIPRPRC